MNTIINLISGHLYEEIQAHYLTPILTHLSSKNVHLTLQNPLVEDLTNLMSAIKTAATDILYIQTIKPLSALGSHLADRGIFYLTNHDLLQETLLEALRSFLLHKVNSQTN